MQWDKVIINTPNGQVDGVAPYIISASRSTDIPAFHAQWFINRLEAGYVKWINPFNQKPQYVSFEKTRAIIFWTKNPEPLMEYLQLIDKKKIPYYFQFTINDYESEDLEPNVSSLKKRIKTFKKLSDKIGKDRVVWRFDPLILAKELDCDELLYKIEQIGEQLHKYTEKFVFSFADIGVYGKVPNNLKNKGIDYREFTEEDMNYMGEKIQQLCEGWGIKAGTCGEKIDLTQYGIEHNKCVDDELLLKITNNDSELMDLFGYEIDNSQIQLGFDFTAPQHSAENSKPDIKKKEKSKNSKDPGQRKECLCVFSKDIGQYNTCRHFCVYCYANTSENAVYKNLENRDDDCESIVSVDCSVE